MSQRLFAIGDIHGRQDLLQCLLENIQPTKDDTLVFLGDFIDRGADSKGVIDTIRYYQENICQVIVIMGNHEEMMIESLTEKEYLKAWLRHGGKETLQSFGQTADLHGLLGVPYEYIKFLKKCVAYYETDEFIFTHATPFPSLTMPQQSSEGLRWRPITPQDSKHISGKTIICGHSEQRDGKIFIKHGLFGIDTFAYGNGRLTALEMQSLIAWQVGQDLKITKQKLIAL